MKDCIRRHYRVTGRVQGVGFRYRACAAASLLDLTGWVENMPDGSVEFEAQGLPENVDSLLPAIMRGSSWIEIEQVTAKDCPRREDEYGFHSRGW